MEHIRLGHPTLSRLTSDLLMNNGPNNPVAALQDAKASTDAAYRSPAGWDAFQCPSLPSGGLPPANTYDGNSEGLENESGAGVIDWQAPRLAYTVNEALCPRGLFRKFFRGNLRAY